MATTALQTFSALNRLDPYYLPNFAKQQSVALAPNATYAKGQVIGELSATPGTFKTYSGAQQANPTAAPVPTAVGTGGNFAAGTYQVGYSYVNATGQTALSPVAAVTLVANGSISVAAITPLPAGVASVNWFVSEAPGSNQLVFAVNNSGAAFTITAAPGIDAAAAPTVNTMFAATDGSQIAKAILAYACTTDASGNITLAGEFTQTQKSAPAYFTGYFKASDCAGLDQNALNQLFGIFISGGFPSGIFYF